MFTLLVAAAWAQAPTSALEQAYQKEFAYLRAEKAELDTRLRELDAESAARVSRADDELLDLQARLVATTRRADRAEDAFDLLEREGAAKDDAAALLATTVSQASDELGLGPQPDPAAALPAVFSAAVVRLAADNAVGFHDETFFLPGGEQVQGRVYRWGRVAAWGISDAGSGALAPAGDGRLQLRREFGQDTAAALASGKVPPTMQVQLFEPERTAEEAEKAGGLREVLREAGTMGQVLFGLGCVSALLVAVRGLTLALAQRGGMALVEGVNRHVLAGELDKARALVAGRTSAIAHVLAAILAAVGRGREEIDRVVDEAILRETPRVDRFASALVVITAGSPLMGLLGTVTGMIATFDVITEHGTGNPKLMSAGIAEALICTALGLAVAIPTLLAGNVLASVADSVKTTMERGALSLLNALELTRRIEDEREAAK